MLLCLLTIVFTSLAWTVYQDAVVPPNATSAEIYQLRCAACHDKPTARIPPRAQLVKRSTEDVVQTMTTGTMKQWAEGLTPAQINGVAVYLTAKPLAPAQPSSARQFTDLAHVAERQTDTARGTEVCRDLRTRS
jgi:mono/diheme cytochrome c family protein